MPAMVADVGIDLGLDFLGSGGGDVLASTVADTAVAGAPLNILGDAAAFTPSAVGDVLPIGQTPAVTDLGTAALTGSGPASLPPGSSPTVGPSAGTPFDWNTLTNQPGTTPAGQPLPGQALPGTAPNTLQAPAGPITPGSFQAATPAIGMAPPNASPIDLSSLSKGLGLDKVNPLGLAVAGAGLGYNVLKSQKDTPSTQAIKDQNTANTAQAAALAKQGGDVIGQGKTLQDQGQQYLGYQTQGNLPPALQAQLDQQLASAKTKLISDYASRGQNADPTQNSSLRADLMKIDQQGPILAGQLQTQLAQTGTNVMNTGTGVMQTGAGLIGQGANFTGMSNQLLQQLSNIDMSNTKAIGTAIANFAAALSGKTPGLNIQIPGLTQATPNA